MQLRGIQILLQGLVTRLQRSDLIGLAGDCRVGMFQVGISLNERLMRGEVEHNGD